MAEPLPERITVWRCSECEQMVEPYPDTIWWCNGSEQGTRGQVGPRGQHVPTQMQELHALLLPASQAEREEAVERVIDAAHTAIWGDTMAYPDEPDGGEAESAALAVLRAIGYPVTEDS
jgi:hypothetical protein